MKLLLFDLDGTILHARHTPGCVPFDLAMRGGFRYTPNVLEHTHGHIPFDNRETPYAGSSNDGALNLGIQRWTGDPDALAYMATYYTPTGALQIPVQTLHGSRDPVVPVWHEPEYAKAASDQGASALLEQVTVPSFGHCNFSTDQVLTAFDRLIERMP